MSEVRTHSEIIASMREEADKDDFTEDGILGQTLHCYVNQLDAAHKREVDELKQEIASKDAVIKRLNAELQKEQGVNETKAGNAAKLREVVELLAHMNDDGYWNRSASICALVDKAKAALAEPPRNCDVGTAEEQCKRWRNFCDTVNACEDCKCQKGVDEISADCFARWAQMPCDVKNT